jgi:hypothetical protein
MIAKRRALHWATSSALGALLLACGTEPNPDVTGAWSLTASYGGGGFACTVVATLTLQGSGSLSGTFAEEQVDCTDIGTPIAITPQTTNVIGTVEGRTLIFTPQPPEGEAPCAVLTFRSTVAAERLSGTVQTTPIFCQGTYVEMTGTWEAQRTG